MGWRPGEAVVTGCSLIRDDDGIEGFGEAAPNRYYGESVSTVIAALGQFRPILERADPFSLESIEAHLNRVLRGNASAKSAISAALHDLIGKKLGLPVYKMWGLDATPTPESSFTIAIAENDELERRVAEARQYPILKIKLGTDRDTEIVRIIRNAAPQKRLRVDANAAWTAKHAVRMSDFLADHEIEILEQPVPANDIEGLRFVRNRSEQYEARLALVRVPPSQSVLMAGMQSSVLPIVVAYRKYYGWPFAARITALMLVTMVIAALIVDGIFSGLGLIPHARPSRADVFGSVRVDYKLFLDVAALALFAALMRPDRRAAPAHGSRPR